MLTNEEKREHPLALTAKRITSFHAERRHHGTNISPRWFLREPRKERGGGGGGGGRLHREIVPEWLFQSPLQGCLRMLKTPGRYSLILSEPERDAEHRAGSCLTSTGNIQTSTDFRWLNIAFLVPSFRRAAHSAYSVFR